MDCPRCGHADDLHGVIGMVSGCMVRRPEECRCPLKWEQIEQIVLAAEAAQFAKRRKATT